MIDASKTVSIHPDVIEIISNFEATAENRRIFCELDRFSAGKK